MIPENIWSYNNNEGFFRKTFRIDEDIKTAYARIYVDTGYELWLNGRFVATVDEWVNTRDYNVRLFLCKGENTIAVHGLNHGGHRGLAFEISVNGKTLAVTDHSWKSCDEQKWGWQLPDYDDSRWAAPHVLDMSAAGAPQWTTRPGSDPERIVPALDCSMFFGGNIPKTCASPYYTAKAIDYTPDDKVLELMGHRYKEFTQTPHLPEIHIPKVISCTAVQNADGIVIAETSRYTGEEFVLDFGRETVGYLRMKIKSANSVSLRIHYAETLDAAMSEVPRDRLQNRMQSEEYRLFGGVHEFEARTRIGFRYARVEVFDTGAETVVSDFSLRTELYPVARRGDIECESEELNIIWQMGERTRRYCMHEWYFDDPTRDRFLWGGDARMEVLINYYTFGDTALFEYSWDSLASCQFECGGIPAVYGQGASMLWDYVAMYIIAFYDYYMYTGNTSFALKHIDTIVKATDYLASLADDTCLINIPANPLGKKWMVVLNNETGYDPFLNELYVRCLKTAQIFAEISGRNEKAKDYEAMYAKALDALVKSDYENRLFELHDDTEHCTIHYELAELDAKYGRIDKMLDRIYKYWRPMAECGADCMYEGMYGAIAPVAVRTDKTPNNTSYCHAWTGSPTVLMPLGFLGIKPIEPGFKKVAIKPNTGPLKYAKCVVPTPYGEIAVYAENDVIKYHLPQGVTAVINNIVTTGDGEIRIG